MRNILVVLSIVLLLLGLYFIVPVSIPLLLALITAIIINPLVNLAEKKLKRNRKYAVMSVFIFVLALFSSIFYYTVTQLFGKLIDFTKEAPDYFNKLSGFWIEMQNKLFQFTAGMPPDVISAIQHESKVLFDSMRIAVLDLLSYEKIMSLITDIPNFLVSVLVYMIALFLFMLELPELKKSIFNYLTDSTAAKVRIIITKLNATFLGFLKAQVLVSLIIFATAFIGLLFIKPQYALMMSLIIWIIDVIPIIGSIVIVGPWSLYYFVTGNIALGTKLAILAAVLLIIRRTVEPKIMGSHIGLKPLPTLIAMFIGLKLFGFLGFFIGPVLVILFTTAREVGLIRFNFKI